MPNRILKESICTSDEIDRLSAFQETVFYRLIVNCDDFGRMDARPKILASKLFPLKDIRAAQIEDALRALTSAELVTLYTVDGKPFLQMKTWDKHQTPRAKNSKCPSPDDADSLQSSASKCMQMQADESKCSRYSINDNDIRESIFENENKAGKPPAHAHGKYGWVKLTDEQYAKLIADLGKEEAERCITYVDESAQTTGNKNRWKDWNLTVRRCSRDGWGKTGAKAKMGATRIKTSDVDLDELDRAFEGMKHE